MSSACVCHTDEWCFYCNMYVPLERKYKHQRSVLGQVMAILQESKFEDHKEAFTRGWNRAMDFAIRRLRMEVISADDSNNTRNPTESERDDQRQQAE